MTRVAQPAQPHDASISASEATPRPYLRTYAGDPLGVFFIDRLEWQEMAPTS